MKFLREVLEIDKFEGSAFTKFFTRIRERYDSLDNKEVGEADPCFILIAYLMSLRDIDALNKRRGGEHQIISGEVFDECESCSDIEYIISKFARITKKDRALKKKVRDRIRVMRTDSGKFESYLSSLERYFAK